MTTWRTFPTQAQAARYELAVWLRILRRRAAEGDGTLKNIVTQLRERVVDEWPDDTDSLRTWLGTLTAKQLADLRARLAKLPLMGRRHDGALNEADGYTLAWAVPRQTKAGEWAVPCPTFDTGGGPEPVWPDPPTIP